MSKAGARILEAARDAAAIARGEKQPARIHLPADVDVRRAIKILRDHK